MNNRDDREPVTVAGFLDGLLRAGYWRERCGTCGQTFDAPEGEDDCPRCVAEAAGEEYEEDDME